MKQILVILVTFALGTILLFGCKVEAEENQATVLSKEIIRDPSTGGYYNIVEKCIRGYVYVYIVGSNKVSIVQSYRISSDSSRGRPYPCNVSK